MLRAGAASDKHESANNRVSGLNSDVLIAEEAFRHTTLESKRLNALCADNERRRKGGAVLFCRLLLLLHGVEKIYTHLFGYLLRERLRE
jgi:hypothetical protein